MFKNILRSLELVAGLLGLFTLVLFWPATRSGFIELDDENYVSGNPYVQQGLTGQSFAWATTTVHEGYWLPVTWLSFILDRSVQGPGPAGFHRTNVLLHAANVVLLFLVAYRLTGNRWASALVAALFGWHPLRVEAVVWISSRKDVLSTFFGLLALLAYLRYTERRRISAPWKLSLLLVFLAMTAGLMAKPMLVTLPFVLLLLDFWPLKRFGWPIHGVNPADAAGRTTFVSALLEKIPLFLLAGVFIFVTLFTHQSSGSMHPLNQVSLTDPLFQIPANYCRYLGKILWPVDLAIRYPPLHLTIGKSAALAGLILVATVTGFWGARRWPSALVGWLFFLGTFLPIIGVVRVGTADFADRFTYIPSIGIALLVTGAVLALLPSRRMPARLIVAGALLAACAVATRQQMRYWADGETLFRRALLVTRDNAAAHNALGRELEKKGRLSEALAEYRNSLAIAPAFGQAHANLGNVLGKLRRFDEAASHFEAALQGTAEDAKIHSNYGAILYEAGRKAEGVRHLREAVRLNPRLADAHFNLGQALVEMGEPSAALAHFVQAARINPRDDAAQFQAGRIYVTQGKKELARACFEAALRINAAAPQYRQALEEMPP